MRDPRRRLLLSPPLLLVALATILGAGTVSAFAAHGPETRVRAIPAAMADAVGQECSKAAGGVGCLRPSPPAIASGSCVATNTPIREIGPAGDPGATGLSIKTQKQNEHILGTANHANRVSRAAPCRCGTQV